MFDSLFINEPGTSLRKKSRRAVVKSSNANHSEYSLLKLKEITLAGGGITVSSDLIEEAMKLGIHINLLDSIGRPYGIIVSPNISETVASVRGQFKSENTQLAIELAREIIIAKIKNQKQILLNYPNIDCQYFIKNIDALLTNLRNIKLGDDYRKQLFSIEGRAADAYWQGVNLILGDCVVFPGRIGRGAKDIINTLLNYGYGILYSRVMKSVLSSGLVPFAGFIHTDRPGKASLVLDLMEVFRQPAVDYVMLDFVRENRPEIRPEILKNFSEKVIERLKSRSMFKDKKHTLENIIDLQVQTVASSFREQRSAII